MKQISAEIIADSISPQGHRITSFILTYPRFIHSELMTHRVFSRNSASSRAIPFEKMVKSVQENPFTPIAWQKHHSGMQGTEYIVEKDDIQQCTQVWLKARDYAIKQATSLGNAEGFTKVTKQLCNRLLEPFMWHTVLLTGTEFENFFELRCPKYTVNWYPSCRPEALEPTQASFKSRKDAINYTEGECNNWKEQDWRDSNESQAEIHIQALAEAIYDAMNESTPKELKAGEYHIPFGDKISDGELRDYFYNVENNPDPSFTAYQEAKLKISTARCARLSYMNFDGNINYEKDIKLHDTLLESGHFSPFEHCCRAVTEEEYNENFKGKEKGWFRNFKGFKSYRQILEE